MNVNKTFTYTPAPNYYGNDSFTYKVNNGQLDSNIATVSITITPVNDPPVAADDTATTPENTSVTVAVLANDSDVEGDVLTPSLGQGPSYGAVVLNSDKTFTYTPPTDSYGTDSFTYKVNDGQLGTRSASENRNHAAACDSISRAGRREGAASPRRAAS
jgi:hypothetical protein